MKRPTPTQRLFAQGWPERVILPAVILWVGIGFVRDTGYTFDLLPDWRATLWAFVVFVLGCAAGFLLGVFLLWLLLSGLHEKLARKNGAPFAVGDRVQILAGPRKGTVSRVYSAWQGNTVRVRLGEREEENFKDIFSPHQLLREDDDEYNP